MSKIGDIYNEVEKKSVKGKDLVSMLLDKFVDEHRCLVDILRTGSREELLAEAEEQEEELCKELKARGLPDDYGEEEDDESEDDD